MGMGPVSGRRGRRAPMSEINVTPLVDVMLVLLIIFMVTAPLLVTGVPVNLPEARAGAIEQDDKPVQISLDGAGQIFIDEEAIPVAALPDRLATIAASARTRAKPQMIMLRADTGLPYGRVMQVMGELNHAGLNHVSLITSDSPEASSEDGTARP